MWPTLISLLRIYSDYKVFGLRLGGCYFYILLNLFEALINFSTSSPNKKNKFVDPNSFIHADFLQNWSLKSLN